MADESSKKKEPMSLNQLHNRFLSASHSKSTAKPYYDFPSEMKNRKPPEEYDAPSFNITDFDSPSSADLRNFSYAEHADGGECSASSSEPNSSLVDDYTSQPSTETPPKIMNEHKFSSTEQGGDGENSATGSGSSSSSEKIPSKVTNEDGSTTEQCESSASHGEPISSIVDDVTSNCEECKPRKVKIQGRQRLCKVAVKDDEEEDDRFHDVESDFSAEVSEFDSPSPVKTATGSNCNGGNEIRDILSDLSSRFEILSIKKGKRPVEQLLSSDSVIRENLSQHKPVEFSEYVVVENGCSEDNVSTASRKECVNGGYAKNEVGKVVSTESFIRPQKNENEDDDDCVVTSGQKFIQKVESRHGKVTLKSDDSNEVHILNDDVDNTVSGDEIPFSLSNPKFSFSLPSKIANMLYPHQREGLKWLWSLHCKGKGGILGDDMGLGKTMQICGFLAGLFHSNLIKRVLVVAPKTLLPHWMKELDVCGLSDKTREYFGTCVKARQYELQYILQDKGVLLTTYDIVRNNVKSLSGDYDEMDEDAVTWDYMILDEGHLIKNPSTQRAKSLLAISCAHRIIISGTPQQNNLKELWALFNFCCPELLGEEMF